MLLSKDITDMVTILHGPMKASRIFEGLVIEGEEEVSYFEVPQAWLSCLAVVVDSFEKVGSVVFRKQKECGAHSPVPVFILLVPRVEQVLLHEDAGVLILLMILVGMNICPLDRLNKGLVTFCNLE
jgi:hypothetical protein